METIKEKLKSKTFQNIIIVVGILIAISIIFQIGVFVGFKKASFSYGWGDNYRKTFGGPRGEFGEMGMMGGPSQNFLNPHGAIGKIIKIDLPTLVVIGPDNVEKVVLIKDDTLIRQFRQEVKASNLKVNDEIVVIGSPNNSSQIEAKLIRLKPAGITASTTPKI
jgi:hypothetical protein